MSEQLWIAVINFASKFTLDAAIALLQAGVPKTIDDAIGALEVAKTKTAQQYLDEAKAKLPPT